MSARRNKKRSEQYKGARKALLVRLPAHVFDKLGDFCDLTGVTRNDFVSSVISETLPQLESLIEAAQEAKKGAAGSTMRTLSSALTRALVDLQRRAAEAQFELGLAAPRVSGGRGAPAGAGKATKELAKPAKRHLLGLGGKGS